MEKSDYFSLEFSAVLHESETSLQLACTCCLMLPISFVYLDKAVERLTSQTILKARKAKKKR